MKAAIRENVGSTLRCSIGLAPNRFLAKVGTALQKLDGLVVIQSLELPMVLYGLGLRDLPGIGKRMLKRLHQNGIFWVEQLCALSKVQMHYLWQGIIGERFWHWLRGDDIYEPKTEMKSFSHSHRLPPDLRTEDGVQAVAKKLVPKAAMRLRMMKYWSGGFYPFQLNSMIGQLGQQKAE